MTISTKQWVGALVGVTAVAGALAGVALTGNHYYSENVLLDEALAAPWIADLENSNVIPRGKVTTASLITHDIEKLILAEGSQGDGRLSWR